jgi:short-subunit dehydrogenase
MIKRTALITGASGGIGKELAEIFASRGTDLILVSRSGQMLKEIKEVFERKYGVMVRTVEKDLSVPGSASEVWEELTMQGAEISYLVNNAGFGDIGMFAECDWDKQERMINLNILALAHLTRLALPGMIARGYGRILNVASTASFQPGPTMSVYFASKAFVLSFSEAVGNEVKDKGVTVTALCPGSTRSGFHAAALGEGRTARERELPSARSVAGYGYRSMMKGRAVAIPGFMNAFMAFCVRFMPRALVVKAARKIQESKF